MIITNRKLGVVKPSKDLRKLTILSEISANPNISQRALAKHVKVTSTMVNNYIQELTRDGLIAIKGETNRSFEYHVTEKGLAEKNSLLMSAWKELIQIYGIIKNELTAILLSIKSKGVDEIAIYGASDTGEFTLIVCKIIGINVTHVFDSDQTKWGKFILDKQIENPINITAISTKNILITSMGHSVEIQKAISEIRQDAVILKLTETANEPELAGVS